MFSCIHQIACRKHILLHVSCNQNLASFNQNFEHEFCDPITSLTLLSWSLLFSSIHWIACRKHILLPVSCNQNIASFDKIFSTKWTDHFNNFLIRVNICELQNNKKKRSLSEFEILHHPSVPHNTYNHVFPLWYFHWCYHPHTWEDMISHITCDSLWNLVNV